MLRARSFVVVLAGLHKVLIPRGRRSSMRLFLGVCYSPVTSARTGRPVQAFSSGLSCTALVALPGSGCICRYMLRRHTVDIIYEATHPRQTPIASDPGVIMPVR